MRSSNPVSYKDPACATDRTHPSFFHSPNNSPTSMTQFSTVTPGTGSPVPAAASPSQNSDTYGVAAIQAFAAAFASFFQGNTAPPSTAATAAPVTAAAAVGNAPTATSPANPATPGSVGFQTGGPWIAGALFVVVPGAPLMLVAEDPSSDGALWYCITKGRYVGVTLSNPLALAATTGASCGAMKSYKTQSLAVAAFNEMLKLHMVSVIS
ncbi:hypothetical protein FB451DRAFT_1399005 [Mycena latifolia]|nr:hypothetical protein FB451DRAFT_1399005 [Mycena latifolia]